jgi:hypothetical protein
MLIDSIRNRQTSSENGGGGPAYADPEQYDSTKYLCEF